MGLSVPLWTTHSRNAGLGPFGSNSFTEKRNSARMPGFACFADQAGGMATLDLCSAQCGGTRGAASHAAEEAAEDEHLNSQELTHRVASAERNYSEETPGTMNTSSPRASTGKRSRSSLILRNLSGWSN